MEINEITTWVEQFLERVEGGYYLVDVTWNKKSQKLEIYVDTDNGVTLGECQKLSREMQTTLDESDLVSDNYVLDISSPGIERPLKLRRQYIKNIGRIILVELAAGTEEIGRLEKVDDEGVTIRPERKGIKGRKTTYEDEKLLPWREIKQTFVQIRF